jgi:hypothetical protein
LTSQKISNKIVKDVLSHENLIAVLLENGLLYIFNLNSGEYAGSSIFTTRHLNPKRVQFIRGKIKGFHNF